MHIRVAALASCLSGHLEESSDFTPESTSILRFLSIIQGIIKMQGDLHFNPLLRCILNYKALLRYDGGT